MSNGQVEVIKVMARKNEITKREVSDLGRKITVSSRLDKTRIGQQGYVTVSDWNEGNITNIKDYGRNASDILYKRSNSNNAAEAEVMALSKEAAEQKARIAELEAKLKALEEVPQTNDLKDLEAELIEQADAPVKRTRAKRGGNA